MTVSSPERAPRRFVWLALLLLLGSALRLWNGAEASLKLDDFHTLHHARASDLKELFTSLERDNHPPLSFLLVRSCHLAWGEREWALRLPAFLAGLATLLLVWRLSRHFACTGARVAATLLLASSSLHIELSTDLRMYGLLALASAGLLDGLVDLLQEGRGSLRTAFWIAVGLHTHYHFLYSLACLSLAALALVAFASEYRPRTRALLAAFGLGGLLALPWYLLGFPAQLEHGLSPGGSETDLQRLLEGLVHLVLWNISVGGPQLRAVFLAGAAALLALALAGWCSLSRDRRRALPVLLGAGAFAAPALAALSAWLLPRAGYEWRYLAGALAPFVLLVGSEACAGGPAARLRHGALWFVCASATLLAVLNSRDPGEEDYQGAVREIAARIAPGDAVVAADFQPPFFPQGLGWDFYWSRFATGKPPPTRLPVKQFALASPAGLQGVPRVYCCLRSLPSRCALLVKLRSEFSPGEDPLDQVSNEEVRVYGRSVFLHVFTRDEDP